MKLNENPQCPRSQCLNEGEDSEVNRVKCKEHSLGIRQVPLAQAEREFLLKMCTPGAAPASSHGQPCWRPFYELAYYDKDNEKPLKYFEG